MGATVSLIVLDEQEFSDFLKRKAKILGATNELKPLNIVLAIEPVSTGRALGPRNQRLLLVEADRVYAQSCGSRDLTD